MGNRNIFTLTVRSTGYKRSVSVNIIDRTINITWLKVDTEEVCEKIKLGQHVDLDIEIVDAKGGEVEITLEKKDGTVLGTLQDTLGADGKVTIKAIKVEEDWVSDAEEVIAHLNYKGEKKKSDVLEIGKVVPKAYFYASDGTYLGNKETQSVVNDFVIVFDVQTNPYTDHSADQLYDLWHSDTGVNYHLLYSNENLMTHEVFIDRVNWVYGEAKGAFALEYAHVIQNSLEFGYGRGKGFSEDENYSVLGQANHKGKKVKTKEDLFKKMTGVSAYAQFNRARGKEKSTELDTRTEEEKMNDMQAIGKEVFGAVIHSLTRQRNSIENIRNGKPVYLSDPTLKSGNTFGATNWGGGRGNLSENTNLYPDAMLPPYINRIGNEEFLSVFYSARNKIANNYKLKIITKEGTDGAIIIDIK